MEPERFSITLRLSIAVPDAILPPPSVESCAFASSAPQTVLSALPIPSSLESPGLAVRGKPVQRDEGPPDLHLSPLHPCTAPALSSNG